MIEICHRFKKHVLYTSETAETTAEAVMEARDNGADLCGADLRRVNLHRADLHEVRLRRAHLKGADLYEADLSGANLRGADLRGANLSGTDLSRTDLYWADLSRADLSRVKGLPLGAALQVGGSKHWITAISREVVRIGCWVGPLADWLKYAAEFGATELYTKAEIAEYIAHLRYVEQWIAARGAAELK